MSASRALSEASPAGGFDKLPDHLVLSILAKSCATTSCITGSATARGLSRLRRVCSRFDSLTPQVDCVVLEVEDKLPQLTAACRFFQGLNHARSVSVLAGVAGNNAIVLPDTFLNAIAGTTRELEYFEVVDERCGAERNFIDNDKLHDLFRVLSHCPRLRAVKLHCSSHFEEPFASRYKLNTLSSLHLVGAKLEDGCLNSILHICPALEVLHLFETYKLEEPVIQSDKLRELTVAMEDHEIDMCLDIKAPALRKLAIHMVGWPSINAPNLVQLTVEFIGELERKSPWNLKMLHITNGELTWEEFVRTIQVCTGQLTLSEEAGPTRKKTKLSKHIQGRPVLEELTLYLLLPVESPPPDQSLFQLSSVFAGLKMLSLIAEGCRFGEVLDIFLQLPKYATKLEVLNVELPEKMEGKAGLYISKVVKLQKQHPQLEINVTSKC